MFDQGVYMKAIKPNNKREKTVKRELELLETRYTDISEQVTRLREDIDVLEKDLKAIESRINVLQAKSVDDDLDKYRHN